MVIAALIIFAWALLRISRTVRGIEGAYPNRGYTMFHFMLVITVLLFNILWLFDSALHASVEKHGDECNDDQKIFFTFALLSYFWDVFELMLCILILNIVVRATEPVNDV